jgi:hypothetical protein
VKRNQGNEYREFGSKIATFLFGVGLSLVSISAGAQSIPTYTGYDWQAGMMGGTGGNISYTSYMASHREQHHSAVTSDGAIHIIVNTGVNGAALQLYSSFDNGSTWCAPIPAFSGTATGDSATNSTVSTDDVVLVTVGGTEYLQVACGWWRHRRLSICQTYLFTGRILHQRDAVDGNELDKCCKYQWGNLSATRLRGRWTRKYLAS